MIGGLDAMALLYVSLAVSRMGKRNSSLDEAVDFLIRTVSDHKKIGNGPAAVAEARALLRVELELTLRAPPQRSTTSSVDLAVMWSVPPEADFLFPELEPNRPEYTPVRYAGHGEVNAKSAVSVLCSCQQDQCIPQRPTGSICAQIEWLPV
jgi:hypothetical protein